MSWALGTDATNNLKGVLVTYLQGRLTSTPFKAMLPNRSIAIKAPVGTEKISGSIKVLLFTGADDVAPHEFPSADGYVMEEMHKVTIDVQSDEKGAKANEDAQVASIIRQIIQSSTERDTLISLGVYNVRESAEALNMTGMEFKRPITFTCSTDTIISN